MTSYQLLVPCKEHNDMYIKSMEMEINFMGFWTINNGRLARFLNVLVIILAVIVVFFYYFILVYQNLCSSICNSTDKII